jgi:hypothetical protein
MARPCQQDREFVPKVWACSSVCTTVVMSSRNMRDGEWDAVPFGAYATIAEVCGQVGDEEVKKGRAVGVALADSDVSVCKGRGEVA